MSLEKISNLILAEINNNNPLKAFSIANSIKSNDSNVIAHLHHLKSIAYQKNKDYELCLTEIEKGLTRVPNHLYLNLNKAKLLSVLGEVEKSINQYCKVLSLSEYDLEALNNITVLLLQKGDLEQAKLTIDKAMITSPKNSTLLLTKIKVYLQLGEYSIVNVDSEYYISKFGESTSVLNSKGIALKHLSLWEQAIVCFNKALGLNPSMLEAKKNLASCYHLLGTFNKAKSIYVDIIKQSPLDLDSHHWLNKMLWEIDDSDFLSSYNYALKSTNNNIAVKSDLAEKLYNSGQEKEAYLISKKLLNKHECPQKLFLLAGDYERENNLFDESLKTFSIAHNQFENEITYKELAKSYMAINQPEKALPIIKKLLEKDKFNQEYWCLKITALRLLESDLYLYYCNYDSFVMESKINTPNGYNNLSEFLEEVTTAVKQYHYFKKHPLDQSLFNGSQTAEKLFDYQLPILSLLKQELRELTVGFLSKLPTDHEHPFLKRNTLDFKITDSWSVILKDKGFHKNHYHTSGWMSSPFYLAIPALITKSKNKEGWLKLGEPGFNMYTKLVPEVFIKPEEGKLVQFPSYVWHGTNKLNGAVERIAIAYDLVPIIN